MHWWCGRCKTKVTVVRIDDTRGYKNCKCTELFYKGASPWWRVPDTLWEKIQCWIGTCRWKGTCSICDADHYRNHKNG